MKIDKLWQPTDDALPVYGIIYGNLPSKANQRKLVTFGGRSRVIKSDRAREWEDIFTAVLRYSKIAGTPIIKGIPLRLEAVVYFDSMRQDVEVELLKDMLQSKPRTKTRPARVGIIENDRYIFDVIAHRMIDQVNPRVEFIISKLDMERRDFSGFLDGRIV